MFYFLIAIVAVSALFAHLASVAHADVPFNDLEAKTALVCDARTLAGDNLDIIENGRELTGRFFACREGKYKGVTFNFYCVGDTQDEANKTLSLNMIEFCHFVDTHF